MKFSDMIKDLDLSEAARVAIDTPGKLGTSAGEMLKDIFNEFGTGDWDAKTIAGIKQKYGKDFDGHHMRLIKVWNYAEHDKRKYKISPEGLKWLASEGVNVGTIPTAYVKSDDPDEVQDPDELEDIGVARGVKDVAKLKEKIFKVPVVGRNSKYLDQMKKILSHMKGFAEGSEKTSFMLGGEPGSGKCLHGDTIIEINVSDEICYGLKEAGFIA